MKHNWFWSIVLALTVCDVAMLTMQEREHPDEYAAGMFCTPRGDRIGPLQTSNNPCACKRIDYDPECEGANMSEDSMCRQWCHKNHCACPPDKCMPTPPDEGGQ